MISKQSLLLLIIAISLVNCTSLSEVYSCIYDDCDDEFVECRQDSKCFIGFTDIINYSFGNTKGTEVYTEDSFKAYIENVLNTNSNDKLNKIHSCMDDCGFSGLYQCSGKKYYYNQCLGTDPTVQLTCKSQFGNKFQTAQQNCVNSKKCSKGTNAEDNAKYELCDSKKYWDCAKDNIPDGDDDENNIREYLDCEVASSPLMVLSLGIALLSLLF